MISKTNHYIQVKVGEDTYQLLQLFSKKIGRSMSFIGQTLIDLYLPLEVKKFCDLKEKLQCVEEEED